MNENPSSAVKEKELLSTLLKVQKDYKDALKSRDEDITTMKDAIIALKKQSDDNAKKFSSDPIKNAELEKIEKRLNKAEDDLKTFFLKKEAHRRYGTVDGLAETITNKDIFTKIPETHFGVAKSILEDPHKDEIKGIFLKLIKTPNNVNVVQKYQDLQNKIKTSDTPPEDSYIKKSLTNIVGEQAGFLAPPEFDLNIQKMLFESSPLRQVASVMTTVRTAYEFVIRTTLPNAVWGNTEIGTRDTQEQKYRIGRIPIHDLSATPRISLNQLEDSAVNIEGQLKEEVAYAFMLAENMAFIKGDGDDQPTGLEWYAKKGTTSANVAKPLNLQVVNFKLGDYNQADGSYHLADALLDLESALFSPYKNRAIYLISRKVKNIIRQVKDKNNQYLFSGFPGWGGVQGVPSIRDGMNGRINGYPILECDDLPDGLAVNQFPIYFGNFDKYKIIDRIGLTLITDNVTSKGYVIYFFRKRLGAGFTLAQGVKVLKVIA